MTISKYDLIAAGADFALVSGDGRTTWAVECRPHYCDVVIYRPMKDGEHGYQSIRSQHRFGDARRKLADLIFKDFNWSSFDIRSTIAALYVPWACHFGSRWPDPGEIAASGLSLNSLLYSSAEKGRKQPVRDYLRAGADPLVPTYRGDCAARLGVANMMIDVFDRPEWLNARNSETGETGLFNLARIQSIDMLVQAIRAGGDPDIRNHNGQGVVDLIDAPSYRTEIEAICATSRAGRLNAATMMPRSESGLVKSTGRRL